MCGNDEPILRHHNRNPLSFPTKLNLKNLTSVLAAADLAHDFPFRSGLQHGIRDLCFRNAPCYEIRSMTTNDVLQAGLWPAFFEEHDFAARIPSNGDNIVRRVLYAVCDEFAKKSFSFRKCIPLARQPLKFGLRATRSTEDKFFFTPSNEVASSVNCAFYITTRGSILDLVP